MINLAEQLATMTCVEHISQKKTELNDIYRNYVKSMTIIA